MSKSNAVVALTSVFALLAVLGIGIDDPDILYVGGAGLIGCFIYLIISGGR